MSGMVDEKREDQELRRDPFTGNVADLSGENKMEPTTINGSDLRQITEQTVERVVREMLPEIAARVIREELEKLLKED